MLKDSISASPRLLFVDALRGIAALMVTLYHFTGNYPAIPAGPHDVPTFRDLFEAVALHGGCGVDIFFAISGFVIAYSLRNLKATGRNAGIFVLRRSLRLDPPYLVTLFGALGCAALSRLLLHDSAAYVPASWIDCLVNMVYLQDFLHVRAVVAVAWTLCIEIQFYLVFVLIWWLTQRVGAPSLFLVATLGSLTAWSLLIRFQLVPEPLPGLFIEHWYLFQLGMLVCWTLVGRIHGAWLAAAATAAAGLLALRWHSPTVVGLATALSIYATGKAGHLGDWLAWKPLQYLGRRSYSIYLVHTIVGSRVMNIMWRLTGGAPSFSTTLVFMVPALLATLVAAELLYRWVEKPSVEIAKRLKGAREEPPAPVSATRMAA
ncbi:MAG TPA: acyltransferase [Gemmataceae bacterium]|nr:acyltransferase [Gemmataceae bacterium]